MYNDFDKVWYNKSQNRRYLESGNVKEYLEGTSGKYTSKFLGSQSYQQIWINKDGNWEEEASLYSGFGVRMLRFLNNIKNAEQIQPEIGGRYAFRTYRVTIDKDVANKAAEDEFNKANMFNQDIDIIVSVDYSDYVVAIFAEWKDEVFNNKNDKVNVEVHIGDFNKTSIKRPKGLENIEIKERTEPDTFTQNKKRECAVSIQNAYNKTYNVNSATYEVNGKVVECDIAKNDAIFKENGNVTYYNGNDGMYLDYHYVTPDHHQESWTKGLNQENWVKNVTKHTNFKPRELYFLNKIFDVKKYETNGDLTVYTVEVLKQDANNAYSYAYDVSNRFTGNIEFTVALDSSGYVREIHINQEGYKLDLKIWDINNTNIVRPDGIE